MRFATRAILCLLALPAALRAQAGGDRRAPKDTSFAAMQERGKKAMGVDQYTSTHTFDALPTGGRIRLVRDKDDSAGVAQIRAHMRDIARAFKAGDFSTPEFVHMQDVPGTQTMRAKRAVITYAPRDIPRGAELLIQTTDPAAIEAVHQFMAFQRDEHHAGGMSGMKHP